MGRITARACACLAAVAALSSNASAHPAGFSTIDLHLRTRGTDGAVTLHIFDVARELKIEPPERLLDPARLLAARERIIALLDSRLDMRSGGRIMSRWRDITPIPSIQSVRLAFDSGDIAGASVTVSARLFPYDAFHQTFLNVYEGDTIQEQLLFTKEVPQRTYYSPTLRGTLAIGVAFSAAGIARVVSGPHDLLFLAGLLLLAGHGTSLRRLVVAFVVGHAITTGLSAAGVFVPDRRLVQITSALAVVFVGLDDGFVLIGSDGRDLRAWLAAALGGIKGLGAITASGMTAVPAGRTTWALTASAIGVVLGQLVLIALGAALLGRLRRWNPARELQLARAGTLVVLGTGGYLLVTSVLLGTG